MSLDRRFIEESFPVKEVSVHSAKEKTFVMVIFPLFTFGGRGVL